MDVKKVFVSSQRTIPLGYQGENEVTRIIFTQPDELLGENWTLFHQRPLDREPYPVPLDVTAQGLAWTVTSGDTEYNGSGRAQLICTGVNGEVLKNAIYNTNVAKSLHVGAEPPDPVKPWYDDIMQKLDQAGGGTVKSVNGITPDESGNVEIEVGSGTPGGEQSNSAFSIPINMTSLASGSTNVMAEEVIAAYNANKQIVLNIDGQILYPCSIIATNSKLQIVATYDFNRDNSLSKDPGYSTFTLIGGTSGTLNVHLTKAEMMKLKVGDVVYSPFDSIDRTIDITDVINSIIDEKLTTGK